MIQYWVEKNLIVENGVARKVKDEDVSTLPLFVIPPPSLEQRQNVERLWRNTEIDLISFKINDLEDRGQDASALRAFRIILRGYPQQADFPNGQRPSM